MFTPLSKALYTLAYSDIPLAPEKLEQVQSYKTLLSKEVGTKRQNDFFAGRWCADNVLKKLGVEQFQVQIGEKGSPRWPKDIVGSITHSKDYALAVAAHSKDLSMLGCDLERKVDTKRLEVIKKMALTETEVKYLANQENQQLVATLIFSAKESLYKMLFPHCQCYITFHEGLFKSYNLEQRTFSIELNSSKQELKDFVGEYSGEFNFLGDNIATICFKENG